MNSVLDNIPKESWIKEDLFLDDSPIQGVGVFTKSYIPEGEVVIIWGGIVFTQEEVDRGLARMHTMVGLSEDIFLANPIDKPLSIDDYMNHSCSPNIGMRDEVTLITMKEIFPNNELVADYSIWLNDSRYVMKQRCRCNSKHCRNIITGMDWKLKTVIEINSEYFSPFIKKRIEQLDN